MKPTHNGDSKPENITEDVKTIDIIRECDDFEVDYIQSDWVAPWDQYQEVSWTGKEKT